uniref:Carbohydrate sulfotransferase n=1 Tax=Daphnia magna TaxID=35525 RepID=A0A0P5M6N8_9CRUS
MKHMTKVSVLIFFFVFLVLHLVVIKPYLDNINSNSDANQGSSELSDDAVPPPGKRILIVTKWRSGSTFLGEIISSAPGVFYSYEPLIYFEKHSGSKMELIRSLFQCQFPADYLRFVNGLSTEIGSQNYMIRNRRIWDECYYNRTLCYQPEFVNHLCPYYPIHLIKAVRLRVSELSTFLANDPAPKDWKIVHLIRDPRGTMSSRNSLTDWCYKDPTCIDVNHVCAELQEDLELIQRMIRDFPDRHYLMKFEDLAVNTEAETEKLFRFLGMSVTELTKAFLESHTQSDNQTKSDPYSTFRQSNAIAYGWKSKLSEKEIATITDVCAPALQMLSVL